MSSRKFRGGAEGKQPQKDQSIRRPQISLTGREQAGKELLVLPPFSTTGLGTKPALLSGVALGATPIYQMHTLGGGVVTGFRWT